MYVYVTYDSMYVYVTYDSMDVYVTYDSMDVYVTYDSMDVYVTWNDHKCQWYHYYVGCYQLSSDKLSSDNSTVRW
jgi:hypothetical protein